jgi:alpha-beta hydrolase superfamily lysophospholipase
MTATGTSPSIGRWDAPAAIATRGTLIVISGRGEHPGLYERFGKRISFDAYDVRVVGDPAADPDAVLEQIRELAADAELARPLVLAGSDGGALFAVSLVVSGAVAADGLVLAGIPVATAPASVSPDWEAEIESRSLCPTHRARLQGDAGFIRGALNKPLPTAWHETLDLSAIPIPILGLHGQEDPVSPLEDARQLYVQAPTAELLSIAGGRHDAFNDQTHRTAAASLVLFLERLRSGDGLAPIATQELSIL